MIDEATKAVAEEAGVVLRMREELERGLAVSGPIFGLAPIDRAEIKARVKARAEIARVSGETLAMLVIDSIEGSPVDIDYIGRRVTEELTRLLQDARRAGAEDERAVLTRSASERHESMVRHAVEAGADPTKARERMAQDAQAVVLEIEIARDEGRAER